MNDKVTLRARFRHALNINDVKAQNVGGPYNDNEFHVFANDVQPIVEWAKKAAWIEVKQVEGRKIEVVCDYYAMPPFDPTPEQLFVLMEQMGAWFVESKILMRKHMHMKLEISNLVSQAEGRNNERILKFIAGESYVTFVINANHHMQVWKHRLYLASNGVGLKSNLMGIKPTIEGTEIRFAYDRRQMRGLSGKFIMPHDSVFKHTIRHQVYAPDKDILVLEFEG